MSVNPRHTMSTGITSRHFRSLEGSWRKFVPRRYESGPEVLMPSFQPVNGERSELSTIEGRTTAMGRSRPRRGSFIPAAAQRLTAKRLGQLRTFSACFDSPNRLAQRIDLALGIELRGICGIVIVAQLLGNAAVAHAYSVAGREMHEPGVIALSQKFQQMDRRIDIGRDGITQIWIEIRQASAVHDEVK